MSVSNSDLLKRGLLLWGSSGAPQVISLCLGTSLKVPRRVPRYYFQFIWFCNNLRGKEAKSHSIFKDAEIEHNKIIQSGFSNYKSRILPFTFSPRELPTQTARVRPYLHGVAFLIFHVHPNSSQELASAEERGRFGGELMYFNLDIFFFSWTPLGWTPWGQAQICLLPTLSHHIEETQRLVHDKWMQRSSGMELTHQAWFN